MKKILSLFLIFWLCLSLIACGVTSETDRKLSKKEKEIVGTWVSPQLFTIKFKKDGTGTVADSSPNSKFTWKYDKELKCYSVAMSSEDGVKTFDFTIHKTKNSDVSYIIINGEFFYRTEDGANANSIVTVINDSMFPLIHSGDIIYLDPVDDPTELRKGDVISYWTVIDGERVINTSRIAEIYDGGGYLIFVTKGDANSDINPLTVHESEILGKFSKVIVSGNSLDETIQ